MATPIENNTEELREVLQQVYALPEIGNGQKYGKLVVFGDSVGLGSKNNDYSFVDVLRESGAFESVVKACKGSACIGPYQKDASAAGYSLVEQIERYASDVRDADIIICEYGGNDVASTLDGNVEMGSVEDASTAQTICGYTKRALERIYELNPDVAIHWLPPFSADFGILKNNLPSTDINFADVALLFYATALQVTRNYGCYTISNNGVFDESLLSSDGLHPNTVGHERIAEQVLHNMFQNTAYVQIHRPLTLTSTNGQNLSFDGSFDLILALLKAGVSVTVTSIDTADSVPIVFYPNMYEPNAMLFTGTVTTDGTGFVKLALGWFPDGMIHIGEDNSGTGLTRKDVSASSQTTMNIGDTHTLKESIIGKSPVYSSLQYILSMGRVSGSSGNYNYDINCMVNSSTGMSILYARFSVSDDGLTLTLNTTKRVNLAASGVTVENSVSFAFGTVFFYG